MTKKKKGFSLIELLVALAIIGLLSTLGIASMSVARNKANIAHAEHELAELYKSIEMLAYETNEWPGHQRVYEINESSNNEICEAGCAYKLSSPEAGLLATDGLYQGWNGPYLKKIMLDPWNREYFFDTDYDLDENVFAVIGSYGLDGLSGPGYNEDNIIKILIIK